MLLGKYYDTTFSSNNAQDFLDCHAYVLNLTKTKCSTEYEMVKQCVVDSGKNIKKFPHKCVNLMEFFISCQ